MHFQGKNIAHHQGRRYLFRNINFSLNRGELLLVKGQNGSGKTTLLKILTGLVLPQKGQIQFDGENILTAKTSFNAKMGYLGHKNSLKMWLTPLENMTYHTALANNQLIPSEGLEEMVATLDLKMHLNTPCRQLSAGQCRKVALIAMLLKGKALWILDEPFTALDSESVAYFKNHFSKHLLQGGMIILSSHNKLDEFLPQIIDLTKQKQTC